MTKSLKMNENSHSGFPIKCMICPKLKPEVHKRFHDRLALLQKLVLTKLEPKLKNMKEFNFKARQIQVGMNLGICDTERQLSQVEKELERLIVDIQSYVAK